VFTALRYKFFLLLTLIWQNQGKRNNLKHNAKNARSAKYVNTKEQKIAAKATLFNTRLKHCGTIFYYLP
jgi:hypothetical protein